ncbi:hypothetical protein ACFFMR_13950 [Micromonospora andamanensis]|uniref:Uncharacterized protein n=1 Tax=Micromonospora andamanensis TaxID=1287068 RepID=A0ABQ4I4M2_9ACTN|nr:hypothetical protein [Micromonospora andamanensis]GIJ12824.1 hypothetical protein Van01_60380 [Micromonospora andamanensis]
MSTFDEYAALARHLAVQQRAGEQGAAAEAERQRDLGAAVEYLDRRLTAQGQRLDHLGRTIGVAPGGPAPTAAGPGGPLPGGPPPGAPPGAPPVSGPPAPPGPPPTGAPVSGPPGRPLSPPGYPGTAPGPGTGSDGGAAAAPGRPGVGAYSPVGVGQPGPALPVAVSATAAGVPGPRVGEVDPATELELARRWADEADRHGQQAELLAQQPALLPTWSPVARAVAVYLGFAGVAVVLMLVMALASGVGVVGFGTLVAWMCAGLPAVALIGGWLVLGRWGRPAVGAATPPRYPVLGFLLCFLAVPLAYCGYLLLFRAMR